MSKLRKSAQGRRCLVYGPTCNNNPETVVLAHLNGGGMGMKQVDVLGAWACSACHEFLDGGYARRGWSREERDLQHARGIFRTLEVLWNEGTIGVIKKS